MELQKLAKELGEYCSSTPITIILAQSGAGAPLLLSELIEQNNWKTKNILESENWFASSKESGVQSIQSKDSESLGYSVFVLTFENFKTLTTGEFLKLVYQNSENSKVIILAEFYFTSSLLPLMRKDHTLITVKHPIMRISARQVIKGKPSYLHEGLIVNS